MSRIPIKASAYTDAFIGADGTVNTWSLIVDQDGNTLSEEVAPISSGRPNLRSARLDAVRLAMQSAFSSGIKDLELYLPDASLAMELEHRKPVERSLMTHYLMVMAMRHAFRSATFKPGTMQTIGKLSLGLA